MEGEGKRQHTAGETVVMSLDEWAQRWRIPPVALDELFRGCVHVGARDETKSEARVQSEVRYEAAQLGHYLFRNNVGAGTLDDGSFVRWGLANDSKQLNERIKSGDLIGWRRVTITPNLVGRVFAQFCSREVKRGDWKFSGTLQEQAQARWAALINSHGGDAKIVQGPGSFT